MDFLDSLAVAFHIWQLLALSPFTLKDNQMIAVSKNTHRNFSYAVMLIQVVVIILSLVFIDHIIFPNLNQTIRALDIMTMLFVQLTALVIFWESYTKRSIQLDFLRNINSIDFILEYKIGISPNYVNRRKTNVIRLVRWIFMDISFSIVNFVAIYHIFTVAYRWWIIMYPSIFICSMRYFQVITFVDIIHHRYYQINRCIDNLQLHKEILEDETKNVDFVERTIHIRTIFQKYKSGRTYEKLFDLRRVCRLLSSANRSINEMFQLSIPAIIFNDFVHILLNSYWTLRIFLEHKTPLYYVVSPLLWAFLNFIRVFALSAACHHATDEVIETERT